jgi:hypothetical protein
VSEIGGGREHAVQMRRHDQRWATIAGNSDIEVAEWADLDFP